MSRLILVFSVIAAVSMVNAETSAQRAPKRVNQVFRFLGGGWSGGYHWRTPGPRVEYYNPYSHHNSRLKIGGYPQGAGRYVSQLGCYYDGPGTTSNTNSFDQIGDYQTGGYEFMPAPTGYQSRPPSPKNVVNSVVDNDENGPSPNVDYRQGPENMRQPEQESILIQPKESPTTPRVDPQPSPSDKPIETKDDVGMWNDFDELESLDKSLTGGGG